MANSYRVQLAFGPCAGRLVTLTDAQLKTLMWKCGGVVYTYNGEGGDGTPDHPFVFQDLAAATAGGRSGLSFTPSDVFSAWHTLMYTLGHRVPASVTRIRGDLTRIRKAVR